MMTEKFYAVTLGNGWQGWSPDVAVIQAETPGAAKTVLFRNIRDVIPVKFTDLRVKVLATCELCEGAGDKVCPECSDPPVGWDGNCTRCNNTGFVDCPDCGGKGAR